MTYQLYGDIGSGSAIVEMALAELGQEPELHDVPLKENAQRAGDYAALNPQRKLPCLVTPDGETLTESAAILLTLDERFPEAGLLPAAQKSRAQARRWLIFMAAELYPVIEIVDYPERFQPEEGGTSEARREGLKRHASTIWKRRLSVVEHAIAGKKWFLESGFSALDIYASVLSRWTADRTWQKDNLPRIESIAQRLSQREKLDVVWRRHFGN
ncbi:MAG: glutathione S-transferase family protein [Woeseia sp.]|nr:glutathione S-transferase family protein [Woeseia sp.]MBT8097095.1 glutathione S-transferase family protein [Woeseia sp.]NNE62049.1 glutathione S-transferase family protein [Woeseia sp.]NNL53660.1 glutathione S-transferase family protein [Woeseia sp.]